MFSSFRRLGTVHHLRASTMTERVKYFCIKNGNKSENVCSFVYEFGLWIWKKNADAIAIAFTSDRFWAYSHLAALHSENIEVVSIVLDSGAAFIGAQVKATTTLQFASIEEKRRKKSVFHLRHLVCTSYYSLRNNLQVSTGTRACVSITPRQFSCFVFFSFFFCIILFFSNLMLFRRRRISYPRPFSAEQNNNCNKKKGKNERFLFFFFPVCLVLLLVLLPDGGKGIRDWV